jgi:hypothetical protein
MNAWSLKARKTSPNSDELLGTVRSDLLWGQRDLTRWCASFDLEESERECHNAHRHVQNRGGYPRVGKGPSSQFESLVDLITRSSSFPYNWLDDLLGSTANAVQSDASSLNRR